VHAVIAGQAEHLLANVERPSVAVDEGPGSRVWVVLLGDVVWLGLGVEQLGLRINL